MQVLVDWSLLKLTVDFPTKSFSVLYIRYIPVLVLNRRYLHRPFFRMSHSFEMNKHHHISSIMEKGYHYLSAWIFCCVIMVMVNAIVLFKSYCSFLSRMTVTKVYTHSRPFSGYIFVAGVQVRLCTPFVPVCISCKGKKNDLYASFTIMQIRFFRVFHSFSERKRS